MKTKNRDYRMIEEEILEILRNTKNQEVQKSILLRNVRLQSYHFDKIINNMCRRGIVIIQKTETYDEYDNPIIHSYIIKLKQDVK